VFVTAIILCSGNVLVHTTLASTPTVCQWLCMISTGSGWYSDWKIRRLTRRRSSCWKVANPAISSDIRPTSVTCHFDRFVKCAWKLMSCLCCIDVCYHQNLLLTGLSNGFWCLLCFDVVSWERSYRTYAHNTTSFQPLCRSDYVSRYPLLRSWCKVLSCTCPCWWQLAHSD